MTRKPLFEQYRPQTWSDVVGQDKALKTIEILRNRGLGGRAYFISGKSGTGKSSIGRLICAETCSDDCILVYAGDELTPGVLEDLERKIQLHPWGKGGWGVVIEECHGLKAGIIRRLDVLLERIPAHVTWVLTTTFDGEEQLFEGVEAAPLLSRCTEIALSQQGIVEPMAKRLQEVARAESLDGRELSEYIKLLRRPDVKCNMRKAYQIIEAGGMLL